MELLNVELEQESILETLSELTVNVGISDEIKQALLNCFQKVAWIDDQGQDYYDALYDALYPPVGLDSISCVYTQSGTVYDTDSLDSLKTDLVVTAHYSDQSTETVTTYTLSGTLAEGTSTITVSYGGKTTTFNVTVTHQSISYVTDGLIARWDGIDNTKNGHNSSATVWEDLVGSYDLTLNDTSKITWNADSANFAGASGTTSQYLINSTKGFGNSAVTIEMVFESETSETTQYMGWFGQNGLQRSIAIYNDNTFSCKGSNGNTYDTGLTDITDIRSIAAVYDSASSVSGNYYCNNVLAEVSNKTHSFSVTTNYNTIRIGAANAPTANYAFKGKLYAIRVYNRQLSVAELTQNYNADVERFELGE